MPPHMMPPLVGSGERMPMLHHLGGSYQMASSSYAHRPMQISGEPMPSHTRRVAAARAAIILAPLSSCLVRVPCVGAAGVILPFVS